MAFFRERIKPDQVISGTFGKLWINSEKLANVKGFEAKVSPDFEEMKMAEKPGTQYKYMGFSGEGTFTLHKVDSGVMKLYAEGIRSGVLPDVSIVAAVEDPAALGAERVQFIGVTFDEITLMKFATGEIGEEEVPFKFGDFILLDTI